jgi:rapamycin-insensitive companion of mTOR
MTLWATGKPKTPFLKMKRHSHVIFKDLCFYSKVCQLMCHFSFRLVSRRFLRELFMDVNFVILAEDARSLLASHKHCSHIETEDNNQSILE